MAPGEAAAFCQWASDSAETKQKRSCEQAPFSSVHDWGRKILNRDNCNPLLKYVEIAIHTNSLQPDFSSDIVSRGGWKYTWHVSMLQFSTKFYRFSRKSCLELLSNPKCLAEFEGHTLLPSNIDREESLFLVI